MSLQWLGQVLNWVKMINEGNEAFVLESGRGNVGGAMLQDQIILATGFWRMFAHAVFCSFRERMEL